MKFMVKGSQVCRKQDMKMAKNWRRLNRNFMRYVCSNGGVMVMVIMLMIMLTIMVMIMVTIDDGIDDGGGGDHDNDYADSGVGEYYNVVIFTCILRIFLYV